MERDFNINSPLVRDTLYGHVEAEKEALAAFANGKIPGAWLITGPRGVGKATLAYRFSKFILTNRLPTVQDDRLFGDDLEIKIPDSLQTDSEKPAIVRIKAGSHGDLLVIDTENLDENKVRKEISIDEVRKIGDFLSLTASESDFRVVIIDSADEMNRNAANAILKILEEPPKNSLMLMTSHNPGRLLPTIRSRCRILKLSPIGRTDLHQIVSELLPDATDEEVRMYCVLSEGSPGRAVELYENGGIEIYETLIKIFSQLPEPNISDVDGLGTLVSSKGNEERWLVTTYLLQYILAEIVRSAVNDNVTAEISKEETQLKRQLAGQTALVNWAELWKKIGKMVVEADYANLDKKHTLITMFNTIKSEVA